MGKKATMRGTLAIVLCGLAAVSVLLGPSLFSRIGVDRLVSLLIAAALVGVEGRSW